MQISYPLLIPYTIPVDYTRGVNLNLISMQEGYPTSEDGVKISGIQMLDSAIFSQDYDILASGIQIPSDGVKLFYFMGERFSHLTPGTADTKLTASVFLLLFS